jgi:alpha-glucosidase
MARATYHGVKDLLILKDLYNHEIGLCGSTTLHPLGLAIMCTTWEHLWIANIQVQRMSISGMGFTGSDIGGFAEQPSGDYMRWIQLGVFILL